MSVLIRPEDYPDPNWCPRCGELLSLCDCPAEDWDFGYIDEEDIDSVYENDTEIGEDPDEQAVP